MATTLNAKPGAELKTLCATSSSFLMTSLSPTLTVICSWEKTFPYWLMIVGAGGTTAMNAISGSAAIRKCIGSSTARDGVERMLEHDAIRDGLGERDLLNEAVVVGRRY